MQRWNGIVDVRSGDVPLARRRDPLAARPAATSALAERRFASGQDANAGTSRLQSIRTAFLPRSRCVVGKPADVEGGGLPVVWPSGSAVEVDAVVDVVVGFAGDESVGAYLAAGDEYQPVLGTNLDCRGRSPVNRKFAR